MKNLLSKITSFLYCIDKFIAYFKCWNFHTSKIDKERVKLGSYHKCNICGSEYLTEEYQDLLL